MFMQKAYDRILKVALTVVLTVLAAGCVKNFDTSGNLRNVLLQVNIDAEDMTKATPTDAESTVNTVRIYAYRSDGVLAGHFYRADVSDAPIVMDLRLPMTGTHDVKFYVIVNEASMDFDDGFTFTETLTESQLKEARFHNVVPSYGFPMYCESTESINVDNVTQTPNTTSGHEGHFYLTQKVTFYLIRPMAKLSVYAAMVSGGTGDEITIEGLAFQQNGTRKYNYILPQTDQVLSSVETRNSGRDLIDKPVTLAKEIDKTDKSAVATPENYQLLVTDQYLGETEAGSDDWTKMVSDRQAVIQVKYSVGGEINLGYIYLPAIERNIHYKVLLLVNTEGQIVINYTIADWEDANVTQLTFDYPTHTYVRVAPNEDEIPSSAAEMSETSPFKGYFRMSYPEAERWTPVMVTGAEQCEVTVYRDSDNVKVTYYPIMTSDSWYRIEIKPASGSDLVTGDEVEFAITYAPNYLDDVYDYLMINGSQGDPYWPTSSERHDPNKILITVK